MKQEFISYACCRCGKDLEAPAGLWPATARWWVPPDSPDYCGVCEQDRLEAGAAELASALESGDFIATRACVPLTPEELRNLAKGPVESFPAVLAEAQVVISPLDWWHIHLDRLRERFQREGFSLRGASRGLYRVLPSGSLTPWEAPDDEIPDSDLVEIFQRGELWIVFRAFTPPQGKRANQVKQQVCLAAKMQLAHPEARARFEAIWLLSTIDQEGYLPEFQRIAEDSKEHPRVRGAALEGIAERLLCSNMGESLAQSTLQRTIALISDPEPEVRWWTCHLASRLSRGHHTKQGTFCENQFVRPLIEKLGELVTDPNPAGLGWSVGKMAQDAIAHLEGSFEPDRPMYHPYDPWWSVAIPF